MKMIDNESHDSLGSAPEGPMTTFDGSDRV